MKKKIVSQLTKLVGDHEGAFISVGVNIVLIGMIVYMGYTGIEADKRNEDTINHLDQTVQSLRDEKAVVEEALYSEQNKNAVFANQIQEIASTVGVLDKLSKTDSELLQKYSKVYFLNEHYNPSRLTYLDEKYVYPETKEIYIHANIYSYLTVMMDRAKREGAEIRVVSGYRSFDEQKNLKSRYSVTYGSGANQFSADQGYSEHQLGTTVDFTTPDTAGNFGAFDSTSSFKWLLENAHKYGFTLSYPEGNSYYIYEPWHWRFVGVDLATKIYNDETNFYDMDQRTINEYLVKIFD